MTTLCEDDVIVRCFNCNQSDFTTSSWLSFGAITLIRCKTCGILHLFPIQMHDDGAESLSVQESRRQMGLAMDDDPTGFNHGNGILDLAENYKKGGRLLDVGCKHGELLMAARTRGWDPVGLDINASFCDVAREKGFEVYNTVVEKLRPDIKKFDLIILSHVLEHIQRPDITLQALREQLDSRGLMYVETPDVSSPIAWGVYRGRWLGVTTPGHVWAFTSKTLQNVISNLGFEVIWTNNWIPYAPHDYPKTLKGQTRRVLFTAINKIGMGDILGVLARKID